MTITITGVLAVFAEYLRGVFEPSSADSLCDSLCDSLRDSLSCT
jgi:hypothetical protein